MIIIFFLIPVSIAMAVCFLWAFIWAVRTGQYEDTCTPAMRMLLEDPPRDPPPTGAAGSGKGGQAFSNPRLVERAGSQLTFLE